jgi:hypothetical protein
MRVGESVPRAHATSAGLLLVSALLALYVVAPIAFADETAPISAPSPSSASRISAADPLNGGFLAVNMHGMLFHPALSDIQEDLAYARWLGAGVIRVFATDSNGAQHWDGTRVGTRIAEIAPMLRAAHLRLIVPFVNNHQPVPGELAASSGWMDNYPQLLLPFYTGNWRGAYLQFVHDLVTTVESHAALDVIFAWELGNELHTPRQPDALIPFVTESVAQVRALDPVTPILPGTMGANHIEPGNAHSSIARWLYCDAPVDAYTLHAYDWVSPAQPGDMPIDWDLGNIVSQPCPGGRTLPVIVEELGTSRALTGVYTSDDERGRVEQERRQIELVRRFPQVVGFGVWNAESPRLVDRTSVDTRRGLTSYGANAEGGGSCYDPTPDPAPGARCQLEQLLRDSPYVRARSSSQWAPGPDANAPEPLVGSVDPVYAGGANASTLTISGWVLDPSASGSSGVDSMDVFAGPDSGTGPRLVGAQLGLARMDVPSVLDSSDPANAGFSISLPLGEVPVGSTQLTLMAHTPVHGSWLSTLQVVVPSLGSVPAGRPAAQPGLVPAPTAIPAPTPMPQLHAEIQSPQPGDQVSRSFSIQLLAPHADRVDVFLEPDRDWGGALVGSASVPQAQAAGTALKVTVNAPLEAHTLYVHVSSTTLGQEQILTLPVVIRS